MAEPIVQCLKPGCRDSVEFALTRTDSKQVATLYACRNHTDMFHELVLAVKYGTWQSATISRVADNIGDALRLYLERLMRQAPV